MDVHGLPPEDALRLLLMVVALAMVMFALICAAYGLLGMREELGLA